MTSETTSNTPPVSRPSREERQVTQAVRRESDRTVAPRERPKNLGGPRLKLGVIGEIPGFHLYWENDDEGAIEQLLYEGFEFVRPEEVRMQSHIVADKDVADRVSRYVGKKADGSPLRAYLMKCPDEIWGDREADRYERANAWDSAIKQGKVQHGDGRYKPKGVDISLDTDFSKSY
jgi:hypothetical protein